MKVRNIIIGRLGKNETVRMAADELKKYLNLMDVEALVDIRVYEKYDGEVPNILWVGIDDVFDERLKPVADPSLDDAICIEVEDFCGFITGANERAVLIAVYRFLKELGVKWLLPGKMGEVVPERLLDKCCVGVSEVPSFRYRDIVLEGSVSYEHLYDLVDWMPKVGLNAYFTQFLNPYCFMERWYKHKKNKQLGYLPYSYEDAEASFAKVAEDIKARGLIYQMVGHGWTAEPFGIGSGGWYDADDSKLPEEIRECLAMLDEKRGFFKGVPLDTQACYSNPKVISTISKAVGDYCKKHPECDCVVVGLGDGRNNFCECENCRTTHPSDHYINLLNHVDEELTNRGIKTKVCFWSYNESSWVPRESKLNNPERFILVFAPITRLFDEPLSAVGLDNLPEKEWEFKLNENLMPRVNDHVLKLMKGWDSFEVGERCIFDYHFWGGTFITDVCGFRISRILSEDIKFLKKLNINGYMSCQPQRYSFPTNFPMQIMAETLWDENTDFDASAEKYLRDAFGKEYKKVHTYLENLSNLTAYRTKWDEPDIVVDEGKRENNEKGLELIKEYRPIFEKIIEEGDFENDVQKTFWGFLLKHLELAEVAIKLQIRKFAGESPQERLDAIDAYADAVRDAEPELHRVFDTWRQLLTLAFATPIEDAH